MALKQYKGVIDDGTREIPIVNKFGKLICNIYIRPADFSILDRYDAFSADFPSIIEPLKNIGINQDGSAQLDDDWAILKQVETELKKRINAFFDMDEADEIFAKRSPFSSVNGEFFCEIVLTAIGNLIVEAVKDEMALSEKRTEKYLKDIKAETPEGKNHAGAVTADA